MTERTPEQLIAEARDVALSLCLAQVGDANTMADLEARTVAERLGDATLRHLVLRFLALTVVSLAASAFEDLVASDGIDPTMRDDVIAGMIRHIINNPKMLG